TKPPTVAGPGTTSSSSTKTPDLLISSWTLRTTRHSMQLRINAGEHPGDLTEADPVVGSGKQSTLVKPGRSWKAEGCRPACLAASVWTYPAQTQISSTLKWRSARAPVRVVKNRWRVAADPIQLPRHLLRHRSPPHRQQVLLLPQLRLLLIRRSPAYGARMIKVRPGG